MNIIYTTQISKPYVDGVKKCASAEELKAFLQEHREIAADAIQQFENHAFSWDEFRDGIASECEMKYPGDAWANRYGAILLPTIIWYVGMIAQRHNVPEGLVFIRALDDEFIKRKDDGTYWVDDGMDEQ